MNLNQTLRAALGALIVLAPISLSSPASAGDVQGDAYDCQELWVMRNQVFKAKGYCFKSPKAITYFGIGGCSYDDEDSVPLSKSERSLIRDIRASESRQGC